MPTKRKNNNLLASNTIFAWIAVIAVAILLIPLIAKGIDTERFYTEKELASGHVFFSASMVTNGLLPGARYVTGKNAHVNTIWGRSRTETIHYDHTVHLKPPQIEDVM